VTYRCGGDSRLVITRTSSPSNEHTTKANRRVADVAAQVAELRAHGVEVAEYDEPGSKPWTAWPTSGSPCWRGSSTRAVSRKGKLDGELGSSPEGADGAVTTTVTRRVKPGHEPFYERFLEGIIAAAIEFPGHLGVEVFRPEAASSGEYRVVYRFDTQVHLQAWLDSDERAPGWSVPSRT
jgi:heme-degrading monooxygenase HmoA